MKQCNKCKEEKEVSEFYKNSGNKDGYRSTCKRCDAIVKQEYHQKNKDIINEKSRSYHHKNKDIRNKISREYREKHKEHLRQLDKEWYKKNKEKHKIRRDEYYKNNKDKIINQHLKYQRERRKKDPLYKLRLNLGCRTYLAFKSKSFRKNSKTKQLLGADLPIVKEHIEKQFTKGMTWENYGEWHVDHIIPLASAKTEEELIKLCHYKNLQPLWAIDNMIKGSNIIS
jgi:hypothetical protein